ncbi:MAG: FeoB-associated Cys-rich membrane protein [Clostridia bacterium]|nr:FeoB-associated Cys-rich membrane protein [Clostridia bacterium]
MGDIIVLSALGLVIGLVIFSAVRNRKKGDSGCSCGCKNCAHSNFCHAAKSENDQ